MSLKLLIDECLSPLLVQQAREAGHTQSTCVRDMGWSGTKDWRLIELVTAGDYTLITVNARDFRGPQPGTQGGLHGAQSIHAGLVCLVSALPLTVQRQQMLFELALAEIALLPDLVNTCLEVVEDAHGQIDVFVFDLPQ